MTANTATIEVSAPRRFNMGTVLLLMAFGIFRAIPVLASILVVSTIQLGLLTFLLPIAALVITAVFVPFGLGNPYVVKIVHAIDPHAAEDPRNFIVQITLSPRARSGLRAVLEDADDIGVLSLTGKALSFTGDSIKLHLPLEQISTVRPQNAGLRGFFFYGRRIALVIKGLPNVEAVEFAERSSWVVPSSRKITRNLYQQLTTK